MRKKVFLLLIVVIFIMIKFDFFSVEKNEGIRNEFVHPQNESVDQHYEDKNFFFNEPQNHPIETSIKIYKKDRVLELYGDGERLGKFKIALGGVPEGDKEREGDSKTPEGRYYICTRNDRSKYTLFLGLSYPNIEDAKRGLENGLIGQQTFEKIKKAIEKKKQPPWNTPLGGAVGIHGKGNSYDWTLGCIGLSDEDIKRIWEYTPLKTPVEIYE